MMVAYQLLRRDPLPPDFHVRPIRTISQSPVRGARDRAHRTTVYDERPGRLHCIGWTRRSAHGRRREWRWSARSMSSWWAAGRSARTSPIGRVPLDSRWCSSSMNSSAASARTGRACRRRRCCAARPRCAPRNASPAPPRRSRVRSTSRQCCDDATTGSPTGTTRARSAGSRASASSSSAATADSTASVASSSSATAPSP